MPEADPKPPTPPANTPPPADPAAEIAALKAELAALKAAPKPKPDDELDLNEKIRKQKEIDDKKNLDTKALENALRFSMKSQEFLNQNETLLPKDVKDLFAQAEKENYSNAIEKDAAIKAGIVQSFFSVQSNVDLLTPALKASLDEYMKLTKTGKQDKAQWFYESIFEPTFQTLKLIKKAEALGKGHGGATDSETAYKNRMIALSKKHYLGEKNGS